MAPKPGKGAAPPPPKAKAKSAPKWSETHGKPKIKRADSGEIVQEWRREGRPCCIDELDWSSLESFSYIGGGSGGVIMSRFAGSPPRLCCLKPQRLDAVAELCATVLSQALGIPTAQLQVIQKSDEVVNALKQAKPPIEEHTIHLERKILEGVRYLAVIEFVNGPMMQGIEFVNVLQTKSKEDLQVFWEEVGRLIAFDCLINNYDRLPLIWDNDGNPRNVMLEVDLASSHLQVKGIDQAVRFITSKDGLKLYCEKLRRLVQVAVADDPQLWTDGPFKRLESAIQNEFAGMLIPDSFHLRSGLRAAFQSFAQSWATGELQDELTKCQAHVAEVFRDADAKTVGLDQLESILMLVKSTSSLIAEECEVKVAHSREEDAKNEASQVQVAPEKVLASFQKFWPNGHLVRKQLVNAWQLLDPDCTSDEMGAVIQAYVHEECNDAQQNDYIDWSKFLKWLYA